MSGIRNTAFLFLISILFAGLWAGCDGSTLDDNGTGGGESEFTVFFTADGLADNNITDIAVDYARKGVWCTTLNGISFYSYRDSLFITFGAEYDLPDMEMTSVAVDYLTATVWAGTISGAASYSDSLWRYLADMDSLASRYVTAVAANGAGAVVFGTKGGASRYDYVSGWRTWTGGNGLIGSEVTSVAFGLTGDLWIGTTNGISVYDGESFRSFDATDLPSAYVQALFRASDGVIWCGTVNGMAAYDGGSWTKYGTFDGLPSPSVNDFTEDWGKNIWAATDTGVAELYNGKWTKLTLPNDVGSERVHTVAADIVNGVLWIGTSEGLVRYKPYSGE
ncbi:MAG: hypothetical protein J7M24_04350 [Candidatus Latescibacteria bacterium]|nr:hypothetical protein [Candidatus Latescibacterota bacterium]